MEDVMNVAAYIKEKYSTENSHLLIDEMKLHKLMYFAQRESFILFNRPLFDAIFYGWKYGPILKEIRSAYKEGKIDSLKPQKFNCDQTTMAVIDRVFKDYAKKDSWSLSRLTHGELSWINSRLNISSEKNSDNPMLINDIQKDAERIKARRALLEHLFMPDKI